MKMYQIKVKVHKPGFKSKFLVGVSFANGPEEAKQKTAEVLKAKIDKANSVSMNVDVKECKLIKQDFVINPNKP